MSTLPIKTYGLTLRPLDGVTDDQIKLLVNWIKKHCEYYLVVTHKLNESRHIHAGVVLKKPVTSCALRTTLIRLFKSLSQQEQRVFRSGIKVMYNEDFINNYLSKEDDTVVIERCLPEAGHLESYFPPPLVAAGRPRNSMNPYYQHLRTLWYEHMRPEDEINTMNARNFLFKMMYSLDLIKILRDDKTIIMTARHLVRYLKKQDYDSIVLPEYEKEE